MNTALVQTELLGEFVENDEPIREKTQDEKDADAFMRKLEEAKKIIQSEGGFAGLCEHCLGTQKVYINKRSDDYEGIQYREDNEIKKIVRCFCGEIPEDELPF